MERLLEMIGIVAVLYIFYALGPQKWNYSTQASREKRKAELEAAGLSSQFYFMRPLTLLLLLWTSGGTFVLYWLYKQWTHVYQGYKRTDGKKLSGGPLLHTIVGGWSFFQLMGIINRTCEYTQRRTSWPAALWGMLWLGGLVLVFSPVERGWKVAGFLIFTAAPVVFQRRINTLTKKYISFLPRAVEIIITLLGAACVLGAVATARTWMK